MLALDHFKIQGAPYVISQYEFSFIFGNFTTHLNEVRDRHKTMHPLAFHQQPAAVITANHQCDGFITFEQLLNLLPIDRAVFKPWGCMAFTDISGIFAIPLPTALN